MGSPVPLITGMKELPREMSHWNDSLIIDLNNNKVTLPQGKMPALPNYRQLESELRSLHQVFQDTPKSQNSNPLRKCTEEERTAVNHAMVTFRRFNSWILDNDLFRFRDYEEDALQEVLSNFPRVQQEFLQALITSQQYSVFAIKQQADFEAHACIMGSTVSKLDELIEQATDEKHTIEESIRHLQGQLKETENRLSALKESRLRLLDESSYRFELGVSSQKNTHRRNKSWMR